MSRPRPRPRSTRWISNFASNDVEIRLAAGAYLEYLPGVVIPHRHSRYVNRTRVTVAPDATLLSAEILMPGRKYHDEGELFEYDVLSSTTIARRSDGTPLFTEKILVEPGRHDVRDVAVLGGFDVVANVVLLTPPHIAAAIFDQLEPTASGEVAAGASRLPNDAGLVYRVLGMETDPVKAKVREFWDLTRRAVVGVGVPPEFLWR